MDYPHRHGGHGRDDDDDRRNPASYSGYGEYPPPGYRGGDADPYDQPPPAAYGRCPPPAQGGAGYGNVIHVAHEGGGGGAYGSVGPGYGHETRGYEGGGSAYGHGGGSGALPPARNPTFRIFCKAGQDQYSLAVRDGRVCLVRTNDDDHSQHWFKDLKYSTKVKDEEGYPAMVLINKATGEAIKHSQGQSHPVRLTRYNPDYMDESVLWTESRDVGDGFRCIRMVNNIYLNFDALHGDKDHGGVRDGTTVVLWEWCEGDNQRWKIVGR